MKVPPFRAWFVHDYSLRHFWGVSHCGIIQSCRSLGNDEGGCSQAPLKEGTVEGLMKQLGKTGDEFKRRQVLALSVAFSLALSR